VISDILNTVSYLSLNTTIMQNLIKHIRDTVVSGLILLIPAFVLIVLLQKLYRSMTGFGSKISEMLGIKSVAGIGATSIATSLILVGIFYGCGLLVRFAFITRFKDWLEESLLQYIPGYLSYRAKMQEKLEKKSAPKTAVMARIYNGWRPGFLVSRDAGGTVVFIPESPEIDKGTIWVLDDKDIRELGIADKAFMASLQSGKGLRVM
jgi:uncharacterized membrane protein